MNKLFRLFYEAVQTGGQPPIPYRDIRRTTAIMDEVFRACEADQPQPPGPARPEPKGTPVLHSAPA
jgi:hypothetical protein